MFLLFMYTSMGSNVCLIYYIMSYRKKLCERSQVKESQVSSWACILKPLMVCATEVDEQRSIKCFVGESKKSDTTTGRQLQLRICWSKQTLVRPGCLSWLCWFLVKRKHHRQVDNSFFEKKKYLCSIRIKSFFPF